MVKSNLRILTTKAQPNGLSALSNAGLKEDISNAVVRLEKKNPTKSPATSELMKGKCIYALNLLGFGTKFHSDAIYSLCLLYAIYRLLEAIVHRL